MCASPPAWAATCGLPNRCPHMRSVSQGYSPEVVVARNPAKSLGSVPHSAAGERDVPRSQWRGSMIVGSLTGGATRSDWSHSRQSTPVSAGLQVATAQILLDFNGEDAWNMKRVVEAAAARLARCSCQ